MLLKIYGSIPSMLKVVSINMDYLITPYKLYPEYRISVQDFPTNSRSIWHSISNQRQFLHEVGKEMNINRFEDWYQVKVRDLQRHHATAILSKYHNSPFKMLSTVFPEYSWDPFRFRYLPHGYLDNIEHQLQFIESIAKKLSILYKQAAYTHRDKRMGGLVPRQVSRYDRLWRSSYFSQVQAFRSIHAVLALSILLMGSYAIRPSTETLPLVGGTNTTVLGNSAHCSQYSLSLRLATSHQKVHTVDVHIVQHHLQVWWIQFAW